MSNINVVRKNLGPVTAYKYAVQQGYTGTEQEFAALMASYATVAETATQAADDAIDAKTAAEEAQAAAEEAARTLTIDNTLTQPGQAADAKVVGDRFDAVRSDLENFTDSEESEKILSITPTMTSGAVQTDGTIIPSTGYNYTNIIPVKSGDVMACFYGTEGRNFRSAYYYVDSVYANVYDVTQAHSMTVPDNVNGVRFNIASTNTNVKIIHTTTEVRYHLTVDNTLSVNGLPADAKTVGDKISDIKTNLDIINGKTLLLDGYLPAPDYEIGTRYVEDSAEKYSYNAARLSVKRGEYINLQAGDVVAKSSEIGVFGGGYTTDNGSTFIERSSTTSFTAPVNGKYFFWMRKSDSSNFTESDLSNAYKFLTFYRSPNITERVNDLESLTNIFDGEIDTGLMRFRANFQRGTLANGVLNTQWVKYRVGENEILAYDRAITITVKSGFRFALHYFVNNVFTEIKGWYTNNFVVPANQQFKIMIARVTENTSEVADIDLFTGQVKYLSVIKMSSDDIDKSTIRSSIGINPLRFKPFWSHTFIVNSTTTGATITVPNQSLAHINIAHRLGYNVIECNLLRTSDGRFICIHGTSGNFGSEVEHIDGTTDISNIAVGTVTLSWIQTNVRYRTNIAKYRTCPPTVEEFLFECKRMNMIPVITATAETVPIIDSIMGKDNYIAYASSRICSAPIFTTKSNAETVNDIIEYCDSIGAPLFYSVLNFSDYTDAELKEIATALHAKGYYAAYPECYMSLQNVYRMQNAGFDFAPSDCNVNAFDNGNICNLSGDNSYDDFSTDGTVSNGVLSLVSGNQVSPNSEIPSVFLGKCLLILRFSGTISLSIGRKSGVFTSDGTKDLVMSSYIIEGSPTFVITTSNSVDITSIVFKASKC